MRNSFRKTRAISMAVTAVLGISSSVMASTETWTGVSDAGGSYPVGVAKWDASTLNWTNGSATKYTVGDNAVFTDNFVPGVGVPPDVNIAVSGGMNPSLMEFEHIVGSTPTTYTFLTGSSPTSSSSPFQAPNYPQNVTLDAGFLGKVIFQATSTSLPQFSVVTINSGVLELDTSGGGGLPSGYSGGNPRNYPRIILNGGTFAIGAGASPASSELDGLMSVTANSTYALNSTLTATGLKGYNGSIAINPGVSLLIDASGSGAGDFVKFDANVAGGAGSEVTLGSTATILQLEAIPNLTTGSVTGSTAITYDTGTGAGTLRTNSGTGTVNLGALTGGANTFLQGSSTAAATVTYSIGALASSTFNGVIQDGTGGSAPTAITKTGATTLTLTGASTFTGVTTVNTGMLKLDFSVAATATNLINNTADTSVLATGGGVFNLTGKANTNNSQQFAGLDVNDGSASIQLNANATSNNLLLTVGPVTRVVGGTVDFTLPTGTQTAANGVVTTTANALPTGGQQTIVGGYATVGGNTWAVSGTGATAGNITGLATGGYSNTGTTALSAASGLDVDVSHSGSNSAAAAETINSLRFNDGGGASTVDATNGLTIANGGILETSAVAGQAVAINNGTLTSGNTTDLVVIQNNPTTPMTIGSQITGAIGLTKAGPGTLVLTNTNNTYSGRTYITGGILSISNDLNLGTAGDGITMDGGTLQFTAALATSSRAIQLDANGGTIDTQANTVSDAGQISGSGPLTKVGTGMFTTTGANNFNGGLNVQNGMVVIGSGGGALPSNAAVVLGSSNGNTSGVLQLGDSGGQVSATILSLTTSGSGTGNSIVSGNSGAPSATASNITFKVNPAMTDTFAGVIGGAGANQNNLSVTIGTTSSANRTGTLALTGLNTYNGQTLISNGSMIINTLTTVNGGASSLGDPTTAATGQIELGAASNFGALYYIGGATTTDRVIDMPGTSSGGIIDSSGTGALVFSGNVTSTGAGVKQLVLQGSFGTAGNANQIQGIISDNSATNTTSIYKLGTGFWELSGANTYSGGTTVAAGVLQAGSGSAYGAGALTVQNGGIADLNGNSVTVAGLIGTGTIDDAGLGTPTLNLNGAGTTTYTGAIKDSTGIVTLAMIGTGTQVIGGVDTYTGPTLIQNGTLQLSSSTALPTNTAVTIGNAATSGTLDLGGSSATVGSLNSSGSGTANNIANSNTSSGANSTLILNGAGVNTFAGTVQDHLGGEIGSHTVALQVNTGTLVLTGNNSYQGGTTVSGGTVVAGSADALGAFETQGNAAGNGAKPGGSTVNSGSLDMDGQLLNEPITLNGGTLTNSSAGLAAVSTGVKGIGFSTTTAGVGGGSTVTIAGGGGAGATSNVLLGLTAASFTISGGAYTVAPTVAITGDGTGATATATLSGGTITGITITNPGSGYNAVPTIVFNGGTFSVPATGTGNDTNFAVVALQQTAAGTNYSTVPTATFNNGSGATGVVALTPAISSLTLQSTSSIGGSNGGIAVNAGITGAGGLTKVGTDTVSLNAVNAYSGNTTVNAGGGKLLVAVNGALPDTGVAVNGGTLQLGTNTGLAKVTSLTTSGSGIFDVNNDHMIISYGATDPVSTIYGYLKTGYNGGAWTGVGIDSSTAALPANNANYGVGLVDGKDGVAGASVTSGQLLVAYALYGDVNLDGLVNATDFAVFGANFNTAVTGWEKGDFTYSGLINATDFALLGANFGKSASGTSISLPSSDFAALDAFASANGLALPTSVPEPASLGLLTLGAVGVLSRRRRRA